jgi:hypothetical protein
MATIMPVKTFLLQFPRLFSPILFLLQSRA